ncbi:hypothetical protein, partial [Cyclobacterium salsum]|uniref:hypothetical protein n=1 Tax=Cyclobacterium salsum TaxID=2666329 RepID=UPI001F3A60F2
PEENCLLLKGASHPDPRRISPAAPMVLVRRGARESRACPDSSGSPPHLFKSPLVYSTRAFFMPKAAEMFTTDYSDPHRYFEAQKTYIFLYNLHGSFFNHIRALKGSGKFLYALICLIWFLVYC